MVGTVQQLDTAAARAALRDQIARLERELAQALAGTYPHLAAPRPIAHGGPRLLDLGQLERTRDALAARLSETDRLVAAQQAEQAAARAKLHAMYANPAEHKGARVTNRELGLPGCTSYSVRPRLLSAWWRVRVSSGCPL